jgi:hypothetical protein
LTVVRGLVGLGDSVQCGAGFDERMLLFFLFFFFSSSMQCGKPRKAAKARHGLYHSAWFPFAVADRAFTLLLAAKLLPG